MKTLGSFPTTLLSLSLTLLACGGSDSEDGAQASGGAAGQSGKAGAAGQSGKAGAAGQSGKAGAAGQSGKAGAAGQSGKAGQAGSGPAGASGASGMAAAGGTKGGAGGGAGAGQAGAGQAGAGQAGAGQAGAGSAGKAGGAGIAGAGGVAGAGGIAGSGGAAGSTGGCTAAAECPGVDGPCQTRTCTAGLCGTAYVANGTAVALQIAGDCKKVVCDGAGSTSIVPNGADVPNDNNVCTVDACQGGTPTSVPGPQGTPCGGAGFCDAAGQCVGCNGPSDCPGTDDACKTRTCAAGVCGFAFLPNGTAVPTQTPGDCQKTVCDGVGNAQVVADDADLPGDDGNQCSAEACSGGIPSHPPKPVDTPCSQAGGSLCSAGVQCVQCNVPQQCPGADTACQTRTCQANACGVAFASPGTPIPAQTPGDCKVDTCDGAGAVVSQNDDGDVLDDGNQCTVDACASGAPVGTPAAAGSPCSQSGGNRCDGAGACILALPPTVVATSPAASASVLASTAVSLTFSVPMDTSTLVAQPSSGPCSGSVQVSADGFSSCVALGAPTFSAGDTVATWAPAPGLLVHAAYEVRVTTAARSSLQVPLASPFTLASPFATTSPTTLCDGSVVISQVYGGGGNTGATYTHDFVELHNRGTTAVDLGGTSLAYTSTAGTSWTLLALTGTIPPGGYFLVQLASGGNVGAPLPTPDQSSTTISMAVATGKMALVSGTGALPVATCPDPTRVLDLVGYGTANCSERASAPTLSATLAAVRVGGGCKDVQHNNADFTAQAPAPRTSATPAQGCDCQAANESGTPEELDACTLVSPSAISVLAGTSGPLVFAQAFESGVTEAAGQATDLLCELGYGPTSKNPQYEAWSWAKALFDAQQGMNDGFKASFVAPAAGTYRYTYRCTLDGRKWTVCDTDGAGSSAATFSLDALGTLVAQ